MKKLFLVICLSTASLSSFAKTSCGNFQAFAEISMTARQAGLPQDAALDAVLHTFSDNRLASKLMSKLVDSAYTYPINETKKGKHALVESFGAAAHDACVRDLQGK